MANSEISNAIREVDKALSIQVEDIKNTSTMSSLILSVCLIDTLAGFYGGYQGNGSGTERKRFEKFTKKYLPNYASNLYKVRSDLVHSFTNTSNFMFTTKDEFTKAFPSINKVFDTPLFDTVDFKEAIVKAYQLFLEDVGDLANMDLRANFMSRYKSVGIIKDGVIGAVRDIKSGKIVSKIDTNKPFDPENPLIFYADPIKIKK
jgi:hypothetical protein